jgi:tRNA nucleotidyltransferase (CCA-adding enzyme)
VSDSKTTELRPPSAVLEITSDLEKAGFQAWCVGGAVRDALLGQHHLDWDLATDATPDQVRTVFGRKRTIPVGIDFGTVGVLDAKGVLHEVTTFRRDVRTDGRHAVVEFGASLDEDLSRRDFTINAIAFSPSANKLHDPFDGRKDLKARVVRAVGVAGDRMREDRLRALRAIRFASRFGFAIEAETLHAIKESAPHLTRLSAERVKQELEKTMDQLAKPSGAIRLWIETGAMKVLVPELARASEEAIRAVDAAAQPGLARRPGRRLVRLAVLASDLKGTEAFALATRLRFSKHDAQWLSALVDRWRALGDDISQGLKQGGPGGAVMRRWIAAIGRTNLPAWFRLADARWSARRALEAQPAPAAQAVHSFYRTALRASLTEPLDLRDLAVDGEDLQRAGVQPGPQLGKILVRLLDWVLEDPARNTRDVLMEEALRLNAATTT